MQFGTGTNRCYTNLNITCSLAAATGTPVTSGSVFPVGTSTVICNASDTADHRTNCSFRVIVTRDSESPQFRCPRDIVYLCGTSGTNVFYNVTATDNTDPAPVVSCVLLSGSFFPPGTNNVMCEARDSCGNVGPCSFSWNLNPPTTFTLDLAALPGGMNLLADLNANHRLEFAVGTETMVDYARLEVTYCGPQSTLSGVPYSLNNVRSIHQGGGISWRTINSNGPPPTIALDVGQADGPLLAAAQTWLSRSAGLGADSGGVGRRQWRAGGSEPVDGRIVVWSYRRRAMDRQPRPGQETEPAHSCAAHCPGEFEPARLGHWRAPSPACL